MTAPLGKYKLVKLIAAGGVAEVYLARQAGAAGFEKLVCLKRILPHLARDRQFVEMFLNEARLAARLDHPNIVSIYDLGEANGNYFIAMEFIDGPSLRAVAKRARERGERLPIAEVVKIVSMAAAGLHYAHEVADDGGKPLGLVHRDISPDNILVPRNGVAKVVDFGIAKAANSSGKTRTGALKGKVAYMPPEQLRGDPLDRRTDVFALGVVLYEMLAGQRPWEGDSDVSLIGRIMTEEPKPFATVRLDAPPGLIAVLDRALAKDREARYSSCHDLQADLEALLVSLGKTITAARISDFAKAYEEPVSAPDESTGAAMQALEAATDAGPGPPAVIAESTPVAAPVAAPLPATAPPAAPTPAPPPPVAPPAAPTPETPTPAPESRHAVVAKPKRSVPPPAPPPPVLAQGELVLLIRPWAKVEVDGHDVGVTPLSGPLMLAAGEHTVRLVNADLGKDITRTVRITASSKEVLKEILDE